jgi:hypothetical protein
MREDVYKLLIECDAFWQMVGGIAEGEFIEGRGSWHGDEERSFALPQELFNAVVFRWPIILADQDAIIELGTPQARNWRPATLIWVKKGEREDLGVWRSVTEEDAKLHDSWSFFNDRYFICEVDPPANMFEAEERKKQAKLDALDKIMYVLKQHFEGIPDDPAKVCELLDDNLNRVYDNGFVSGAEHMELVQRWAAKQTMAIMREDRVKYGKICVQIGIVEDYE